MMNFADFLRTKPIAKGATASSMSSARNGSAFVDEFARNNAAQRIEMRSHARRITARILPLLFLAVPAAFAQTAASPTPVPNLQFFDTTTGIALPCVGCSLKTYAAGTNTPLRTYTDYTGTSQNGTTITLNSAGYSTSGIWVGSSCYKFVLASFLGVTIWTQDHVCDNAQLLKSGLAASGGAALVGYNLGVTGSQTTTVQNELRQSFELKADFGATGDGTTNDTAAVQAAVLAAQSAGAQLHAPGAQYAVSSVASTLSNPFSMRCDGSLQTTFKRHSSALQASTPLLKLTNASNVLLRDCGWNELGDGTNYTNAAATVYLSHVASATVDGNYSTLGQSAAFLFDCVPDVTFTNNWMENIWNAGFASGGCGTVSAPIYANRIVASNNRCNNMAMCIQATGFSRDIAITGNVAVKSSISLIQMADRATITGNMVDGGSDYGLVFNQDCYFLEGIRNFSLVGNQAYNCKSAGINVAGSNLTIGTTIELPILRGLIEGNQIDSVPSVGIQVTGRSFDHSLQGGQVSVKSNAVTNAFTGYAISGLDGFDVTGNTADGISTDGIALSIVKNGDISHNTIRNVGKLAPNTYYGIKIGNDPAVDTHDLYIKNNTILDTLGNMRGGVNDDALGTGGFADTVRHCGNSISGQFGTNLAWYPQPAVPTIGPWKQGDCIENFPTGANQALAWKNYTDGTPGVWSAMGYTTAADCIAATNPAVCGAASSGIGVVAAGATTVLIQSTAVTASNAIQLTEDDSLGTALGVTCNGSSLPPHIIGGGRTAGANFTVGLTSAPATNPKCFSWRIKQQ